MIWDFYFVVIGYYFALLKSIGSKQVPLIGRCPLLLYHVYTMVLKSFIHSMQALILMTNTYEKPRQSLQ